MAPLEHSADHILRDAGFRPHPQVEIVLSQSKSFDAEDPVFPAAVEDVVRTISSVKTITNLRSPLTAGQEGLAAAAVAARHPALYLGQAASPSGRPTGRWHR